MSEKSNTFFGLSVVAFSSARFCVCVCVGVGGGGVDLNLILLEKSVSQVLKGTRREICPPSSILNPVVNTWKNFLVMVKFSNSFEKKQKNKKGRVEAAG